MDGQNLDIYIYIYIQVARVPRLSPICEMCGGGHEGWCGGGGEARRGGRGGASPHNNAINLTNQKAIPMGH